MVKNLLANAGDEEMQETWIQFLGQEDPLEEEVLTYSMILAWKIPGPEEPGGLQSTELQRVGHWTLHCIQICHSTGISNVKYIDSASEKRLHEAFLNISIHISSFFPLALLNSLCIC